MRFKHIAVISVVGMMLTMIGCGGNTTQIKNQAKADSLLSEAYHNNQYQRLEMLADSLRNAGAISDMKSSYCLEHGYRRIQSRGRQGRHRVVCRDGEPTGGTEMYAGRV